jgi:CheY-like chemotaxis protein
VDWSSIWPTLRWRHSKQTAAFVRPGTGSTLAVCYPAQMAALHRALIVGEHPGMRLLVRLNLNDLPLEVLETNTADAHERVRWDLPHLVVVDLHPPLDKGLTLCRQLRWTPTTATIPCVVLVEGGDLELREMASEAGATICLEKPFRPLDLRHTVQVLLDSSGRMDSLYNDNSAPGNSDDDDSRGFDQDEPARLDGVKLAARTAHHLLNTPLSLALGYGELLAEDPRLPDELRAMAREVAGSVESAATLLQRLVRVSRIRQRDPHLPGGAILDLARSIQEAPNGVIL